jgi:elongator complex protein 3
MSEQDYYKELISLLKKKSYTKAQLNRLKIKLCKKHKVKKIPTDINILLHASGADLPKLKQLQTKPTRTLSGVVPIAIMTKPFPCPHGKCLMCPGGVDSVFGNVPQSYTGKEPATMRAIRNNYDAYLQVFNRLEQFTVLGNLPQKTEIIIMGGTFPSFSTRYQNDFVRDVFQAMNDFSFIFYKKNGFDFKKFKAFFELPGDITCPERRKRLHSKLLKLKKMRRKKLLEAQNYNDKKSFVKCVGLTIETRPDWGLLKHANQMLKLGCTRVELGIQSVYDKALETIQRGHNVADNIKSIKTLKDLGFKLNFHYMPGLPGLNIKKDLAGLLELFKNPDYKPDMLKLYPCIVMPGTGLEKLYKKGKFKPLSTVKAVELIAKFKKHVPEYCRIMRVNRDIPTYRTIAGIDRTNLRQYVEEFMKKNGSKCKCIRCRESGHVLRKFNRVAKDCEVVTRGYEASEGTEIFISYEDVKQDIILGFCRLRFPSKSLRKEITKDSALIRELHVYGEAVMIGKIGKVQHKGIGKKLLKKAEQLAKEVGMKKMVVISGVGVRGYYRKLSYKLEGVYMVKSL